MFRFTDLKFSLEGDTLGMLEYLGNPKTNGNIRDFAPKGGGGVNPISKYFSTINQSYEDGLPRKVS